MAEKKPTERDRTDRLKINTPWEEAAKRLLDTPAGSAPARKVKPRRKGQEKAGPKKGA